MNEKTVHVPVQAKQWPRQREWVQLQDRCVGIFDCPHSTPTLSDQGPLLVRSQDIRTGIFLTEEAAHVSEETYRDRIARAEPSFGDILYSREGTYFGIAAEMPRDVKACLGQRMVLIRPDHQRVNSRFLWYWLNSPILWAPTFTGFETASPTAEYAHNTHFAFPQLSKAGARRNC